MKLETIGELKGSVVIIDHDSRSVFIAHPDMPPIKFSIDHPFIQGTKMERMARTALGDIGEVAKINEEVGG